VSGGKVTNLLGYLGYNAGSEGTATVSSGTWANSYDIWVGQSGTGTLNVSGGKVTNLLGYLGYNAGSEGTATVSSGTWANKYDLYVGQSGTGTLSMTGGLVTVGGTLSQGTYGTINLNAGGTLQIGVGGTTGVLGVAALTNNGTLVFNRSTASTYSGIISGTGAVTKQGGGTLTVDGNNSYSGDTTISGGSLQVGAGGTAGSIAGNVTNNGTLIFNRSDASTYAGTISGSGAVTKTGAGILAITGSNTYSGSTTVSAGELKVNGSTGTGAVTIASGATLSGTGTIGGATTISGTHLPGNSPGIQTFSSDLTYAQVGLTGPQVYWELAGNTSSNSPLAYDQINVGGNLNFGVGSELTLAFGSAGSSVTWSNPFWSHWQHWTFYNVSGTTTNSANFLLSATDWLDGSGQALSATRSGYTFYVSQVGNTIVINYVPEPSTYALAVIGLGVAGLRNLKKRRALQAGQRLRAAG
jgi:fibronectin-binding autotransporter adhesin